MKNREPKNRIIALIHEELKYFPKATIIDIYKLFYQGSFGAAHILTNKEKAKQYLKEELVNMKGEIISPFYKISYLNDYFRVDLRWISKEIEFEQIWKMLKNSAVIENKVKWENWEIEWEAIKSKLDEMGFEYSRSEEAEVEQILSQKQIVHHSAIYKKLYNPHYRVISEKEFRKFDNTRM